jgi:hypothetical protein
MKFLVKGKAMRQLTEVEVREFFAAYLAVEATARRLDAIVRGNHQAAIRYAFQRDLLLAAAVTFFILRAVFYVL